MYIETFVFFDLETTGLPRFDRHNRSKITELSMVAASRRDIETASRKCVPFYSKLSLIFNPEMKIQPDAAKMTGITNALLVNQPTFKNRIASINSFLEDLTKPVCLVAHNGNSFDYKILRAEYLEANKNLPTDIYCVDSLWGFRKILKENSLCHTDINKIPSKNIVDEFLTDDDDDWPVLNTSSEEWEEIKNLEDSFSKLNTSSPKIIKSPENKTNKPKQTVCTLTALYKRLLNKEALNAHRAEADCIMLLECVVSAKQYFLPWADSAAKLLEKIEPLHRR